MRVVASRSQPIVVSGFSRTITGTAHWTVPGVCDSVHPNAPGAARRNISVLHPAAAFRSRSCLFYGIARRDRV